MTARLYYDDSYLTSFSASVLSCKLLENGKSIVYLDQSAFYPTSGGQPFDTGTIDGLSVSDVFVDENGDVAHEISGAIAEGSHVDCRIDWRRRFDHMQQHTGEHMLAGCVHRQLSGHTIGLHLGHSDSSIDVELPDGRMRLSDRELYALEDEVNAHIQANEPIRCYFPTEAELIALPLRKPPTVKEHVRIVQIGSWEYCACGGTHTLSTGEIGLVKIIDARPSKGKIRLTFLCGQRAYSDYRLHFDTVKELTKLLSTDINSLPAAASELLTKLKDTNYKLNREIEARALDIVEAQMQNAETIDEYKVVKYCFENLTADGLKRAADRIIEAPGCAALLASINNESVLALFAKSTDVPFDMARLIRQCGGKGGGSPEFARGSLPDSQALDKALEILRSNV